MFLRHFGKSYREKSSLLWCCLNSDVQWHTDRRGQLEHAGLTQKGETEAMLFLLIGN